MTKIIYYKCAPKHQNVQIKKNDKPMIDDETKLFDKKWGWPCSVKHIWHSQIVRKHKQTWNATNGKNMIFCAGWVVGTVQI